MINAAITARTTVRGFQGTPVTSGDEDSDHGVPATPSPHHQSARRGRKKRPTILDDVVSANCSPVLKAAPSPAGVSGIAKLRLQLDPLSLDTASSSRASSMTRVDSRQSVASHSGQVPNDSRASTITSNAASSRGRAASSNTSGDDTSSEATTHYEINLENDFVSESVRDRGLGVGGTLLADAVEGGLVRQSRKMTADDFEPLRCLGKGTYGTVLLVKQHRTGRLYAQKQFKKASLVVQKKLVEQTKTERQILESVNRHPFVVKLFYAFQDQEKLYLILEYGQGGELFTHLSTEKMFSEPTAAFYMAEMILALSHLHDTLGVVYRDLKPENCLLDAEGHLLLTDFGLSKVAIDSSDSCNSMLGTVEYMAPEVIQGQKYGKAVDWWSLGALGYDLMTGNPPFRGGNRAKIQENILKQKLVMPYFLGPDAKDLLTRLLKKDPKKRLGANMPRDLEIIKKHRFFRKVDWKKMAAREVEPPIQPMITDPELAENFAPEFTELSLSPVVTSARDDLWSGVSAMDSGAKDELFGGFSFVASNSLLESDGFRFATAV
ncbi:uncharacterized protein E0L32_003674 [Thyridium curvatum]|uniref:Uncharacterized protein n=1 Tax=Thyridium curvatum TaxID=1093900 RepID=A0A507BB12_9PEZI|nr:uncharacterized protein E0L32_003674 [Thyridium curvatum]TPX16733.1 hypothetical protein E0L32_003674 [Thyridium curvatum]